jgi:hypothetical protein
MMAPMPEPRGWTPEEREETARLAKELRANFERAMVRLGEDLRVNLQRAISHFAKELNAMLERVAAEGASGRPTRAQNLRIEADIREDDQWVRGGVRYRVAVPSASQLDRLERVRLQAQGGHADAGEMMALVHELLRPEDPAERAVQDNTGAEPFAEQSGEELGNLFTFVYAAANRKARAS